MGRTIPSFRLATAEEKKEWKGFCQALDKKDRKTFDNMLLAASLYNSVSSYAARPIRIHPIFMSIIFHHYKKLMGKLRNIKHLGNKENRLKNSCEIL